MTTDLTKHVEEIARKRWFGHKGRGIASITVLDEAIIEDGPPALVIALAEVALDDGDRGLYQLLLLAHEDGTIRDALEDLDRMRVFGDLMAHGSSIKGSSGVFQFGGAGLDPLAASPGSSAIRTMDAEQSNSSVVLDDEVIVKFFRRLAIGPNPDLELNRLLTNEGFAHVPPQVGEVVYEGELDGSEVSIDLGLAQRFIGDGVEGWKEALVRLSGLYDEIDPQDAGEDMAFLVEERTGEFLHAVEQLGDATASLHVLMSREEIEQNLLPEVVSPYDLAEWADRVAIAAARLDESGGEVARLRDEITTRLNAFKEIAEAGLKTRVHGDYHLGQVLLTPRGWMLLDFEGEPARPLDLRRAKQSPLRDVAGMLRSFNYAASAALMERADPGSEEWARLEPWADTWEGLARAKFLSAYLTRAHEGRFLPPERPDLALMIEVFEIDKVIYEIDYERHHRPDWLRIPVRGLERLIAQP
jgi:trehalose synthase-fused probable maltokinase